VKRREKNNKPQKIDKKLFITILVLVAVGLVAVADASAPIAIRDFGDKYYFIKQQSLWAVAGLALMFTCMYIKPLFWKKIATPLFLINLFLLILVLIPGLGGKVLGARRWLNLGIFSFQPSELMKLSMVLYQAKLSETGKSITAFLIPIFLVAFLIMLEPDLGTTLVIASFSMLQVFVAGANLLHLLGAVSLSGVATLLLVLISDYRRDRFLTFLKQTQDPLGKGYHVRQILLALGTGGIFGIGLGQSRQKYLFLPETATDSIFAVIAEEIGFAGAFLFILAFCYLIFRCIKVSTNAPDNFSRVFGVGVTAWIAIQTMFNIGSMVALMPLTGIPLPFISYGGSSLTTILIACGILLAVSRYPYEKS